MIESWFLRVCSLMPSRRAMSTFVPPCAMARIMRRSRGVNSPTPLLPGRDDFQRDGLEPLMHPSLGVDPDLIARESRGISLHDPCVLVRVVYPHVRSGTSGFRRIRGAAIVIER